MDENTKALLASVSDRLLIIESHFLDNGDRCLAGSVRHCYLDINKAVEEAE